MSAGSLTLGGNLSVAVGPLGRNAEGSGAVNAKGNMAAMYSYSKTKGLFGGVSVEGSVIVERQDANRLAYGANVSVTQILSGHFDPPPWANVLVEELDRVGGGRTERDGQPGEYDIYDDLRQESKLREATRAPWEEEPDEVWNPTTKKKNRSRSGSNASGSSYAFGDGIGGHGNAPSTPPNRSRASSILRKNPDTSPGPNGLVGGYDGQRGSSPKPGLAKRASSLLPFGSGSNTPKKGGLPPSSESYNAGLTWDSSGPVAHGGRSRSGSNAQPPGDEDLLGDWREGTLKKARANGSTRQNDLLGAWSNDDKGLSTSFAGLSTGSNGSRSGSTSGNRSRSNSRPPIFDGIPEDEYIPHETESRFAKMSSPPTIGANGTRSAVSGGARKPRPVSSFIPSSATSPFGSDTIERRPFDDYNTLKSVPDPFLKPALPARHLSPSGNKPSLALKSGLEQANDGYARAVALYEYKAAQHGDLGFVKGDVVVVKDRVGNGDWWKGFKTSGGEGMFPKSYVEVLDIPSNLRGGLTKAELKGRMASPFE